MSTSSTELAGPARARPVRLPAAPRDVAVVALGVATLLAMVGALASALLLSPSERVEGDLFRIFYFHLPLALLVYVAFFVVFVASIVYLVRPIRWWDRLALASAEVGLLFCTLVLATGSLWGRPVWGVWWTWDARLTSTLVLWFIYLGYLMVRAYVGDRGRAARYAAVLGIVGFLDVPIVQFSVNWWRTLHPQSTVTASLGQSLPAGMQSALILGLVAFALLYVELLLLRMRVEELRDRQRGLAERVLALEGA